MTLCQEIWTVNDIQSARIVEQIGTKNMTGLKKLTQARICLIYDRILRKKSRQTRILIPLYLPMAEHCFCRQTANILCNCPNTLNLVIKK